MRKQGPFQSYWIDFAIEIMHDLNDPIRSQFQLRERYIVIVGARHPDIEARAAYSPEDRFDLDPYCRLPHVLHSFVGRSTGNVDTALAAINCQRHVALSL